MCKQGCRNKLNCFVVFFCFALAMLSLNIPHQSAGSIVCIQEEDVMSGNTGRNWCIILLTLALTSSIVWAQGGGRGAPVKPSPQGAPSAPEDPSQLIRVKKFLGTGRQCLVKTPTYTTSMPRSSSPEQEWMQIAVQYDTSPEWLDDIVFQYYVLAMRVEQGKQLFSLYRKMVKYSDVAKGRGHWSTVYLRPSTLKRYGDVVASAVEIQIGGKLAATEVSDTGAVKLPSPPEKWWLSDAVLQSKDLTVREGYLLNREESPFALINIDDNEVIR
jgi:hypothetical protein